MLPAEVGWWILGAAFVVFVAIILFLFGDRLAGIVDKIASFLRFGS